MTSNGLTLNTTKSLFLPVCISSRASPFDYDIRIDDVPLVACSELKILGVLFDTKLSFAGHTHLLIQKLSAANAMILKLKLSGYPRRTLLNTLNALAITHIRYCASTWQGAPRCCVSKIQTLLNKAMRIIYGLSPLTSTTLLARQARIPSVRQLLDLEVVSFIYSNAISLRAHELLRPSLDHHFGGSIRSRAQESGDLYVFPFRTEARRRTIFVSGIRLFNLLPEPVRAAKSLASFKGRALLHIFPLSETLLLPQTIQGTAPSRSQ